MLAKRSATALSFTWLSRGLLYLVLLVGAAAMVIPFLWSITTSFKSSVEVFEQPAFWVPFPPNLSAYEKILERLNFPLYTLNTIKVAGLITLGQLITCSLAGYAFARLKFPGRDLLFVLFLATMMVPVAVTLIPNFVVMSRLKWVDTHLGLVVPYLGSAYGTFLMRQFFLSFPSELEEAARLDGCNPLTFYLYILLPNSKPILAALGLMTFQWAWNDFLWPLIMINSDSQRTLQLGISYLLNDNYIDWPLLMASSVLTNLPIVLLFFFTQKQFVQSLKLSGIKG